MPGLDPPARPKPFSAVKPGHDEIENCFQKSPKISSAF